MSRVGLKPISLPEKVAVKVDGTQVVVEGPKGKLDFTLPSGISLKNEDNAIVVARASEERQTRALHGTARSLINNMIIGVSKGFEKTSKSTASASAPPSKARNSTFPSVVPIRSFTRSRPVSPSP